MTEANCYNSIKKLSVNVFNRRPYTGQVRQARQSTSNAPKRFQQSAFYRRLNRKSKPEPSTRDLSQKMANSNIEVTLAHLTPHSYKII